MHGEEKIDYLHPILKDILAPTFGIPVYQEQIMQIAQTMAGYTLAQADILRRAMGKKKQEEMEQQKAIFIKGAKERNIEERKAREVFELMSHFAAYGFNRSHAVAYSLIAYQTGYLKANYPTAYMAACLINNQKHMDKIKFFIEECQRMGIDIKGPDINKSDVHFINDGEKTIRFGLAAIKGLGEKAVATIIQEREKNGSYQSFTDLIKRLIKANNGKSISKKILETLAMAGAFDTLDRLHRKQYLATRDEQSSYIEQVITHQQKIQNKKQSTQPLLFALKPSGPKSAMPIPPICQPYTTTEKLKVEKERLGFYVSGHPMDSFSKALKYLCNAHTQNITTKKTNQPIRLAGMILSIVQRQNSKGGHYSIITIEDYQGTFDIMLFGQSAHQYNYLKPDEYIYVKGTLQQRRGRKNDWFFLVKHIEALSTAIEKNTQHVQLYLPLEQIDKPLVDRLVGICEQHQGNCQLQVILPHQSTQTTVRTFVRKYQISPSTSFFKQLEENRIRYTLQAVG